MVFSAENADSCLFSKSTWQPTLGQKTMTGTWAPFVLDWIDFMNQFRLSHPNAVSEFNQDLLLDVSKI